MSDFMVVPWIDVDVDARILAAHKLQKDLAEQASYLQYQNYAALAVKRPSLRSTKSSRPKVALRFSEVSTSSIAPAACTEPFLSSRACPKPRGISSTWWVTMMIAGAWGALA